jgi:predicted nucleotidyltransferase
MRGSRTNPRGYGFHMAEAAALPGVAGRFSIEEEVFLRVLSDGVRAIEEAGIPYVIIGGVGSAALGRPRWTHDIDVLVSPQDGERALEVLAAAGFVTERTNDHWIYKAMSDEVTIDLIFRLVGDIYLDDQMLAHARREAFLGVEVCVAGAEDQIVIKAIANDEQSARHWNDALSLISSCDIDWDYLIERSSKGPRRVLSLLVYAQSDDIVVPTRVIQALVSTIYDEDES